MTTTTNPTLTERCKSLQMQATPIATDPPAWAETMNGWRCTLRLPSERRVMTVNFWMGDGLGGRPPRVAEVMEAVVSDATIYEDAMTAAEIGRVPEEEFRKEMGFESQREADRVFAALGTQTRRLKRFLGDRYDAWLWETERD